MDAARHSWLRTAATSIRTALTAAALTLLVGLGAASVLTSPQESPERIGLSGQDKAIHRLMERHNCSTNGFEPEIVPTTAVIRDEAGRPQLVTFDEGWAVFQRERPGQLVAVCLGRHRDAAAARR